VRLFDGTPASDWWILLDMDRHVQVGKGPDATEEHAVILAASLTDRGLRSGQAVGLAAYGEQLVWLPPRGGEGQRWEVLRSLALVSLGSRPLAELLAGMRHYCGPGGLALEQHTSLVIITPAVDTAWVEALVPLLRRGVIPTVLLLDPVSFGGAGNLSVTQALLVDLGVAHYVITHDLLDQPEARPDQQRHRGKPAPVRQPHETGWEVLS
jgi:uncharacterized protein (DUF58 family)